MNQIFLGNSGSRTSWNWDDSPGDEVVVLGIILAVRYKKDSCRICGDSIGSRHFLWECVSIGVAKEVLRGVPLEAKCHLWVERYLAWRWHCLRGDAGLETGKKIIRAIST